MLGRKFACLFVCFAAFVSLVYGYEWNPDMVTVDDSGNFQVALNPNNTLTLVKYIGSETNVTIPDTSSNFPITAIAAGAFQDNKLLESVTLNDSLKVIGEGAFQNCPDLSTVTFGKNLIRIGSFAFTGTQITKVSIPSNIKYIDGFAFSECTSLSSVTIENGNITIEKNAFYDCNTLSSFTITNPGQISYSGNIFYKNTSAPWLPLNLQSQKNLLDHGYQGKFR
jgi:hypothetical protein